MPEDPPKPRRGPGRRFGKGNGLGHGGPAKGEGWGGKARGAGTPIPPEGNAAMASAGGRAVADGTAKRKVADILEAMGARERIAQRWMAIIEDPAHPAHASMLDKGANRLDGAPVQPMSGENGGPLVVVTGVPRAE